MLEKAHLTLYFLQRKRAEFEALKQEIADLEKQVPKNAANPTKMTRRQSDGVL
jgi:hypothetical protein